MHKFGAETPNFSILYIKSVFYTCSQLVNFTVGWYNQSQCHLPAVLVQQHITVCTLASSIITKLKFSEKIINWIFVVLIIINLTLKVIFINNKTRVEWGATSLQCPAHFQNDPWSVLGYTFEHSFWYLVSFFSDFIYHRNVQLKYIVRWVLSFCVGTFFHAGLNFLLIFLFSLLNSRITSVKH